MESKAKIASLFDIELNYFLKYIYKIMKPGLPTPSVPAGRIEMRGTGWRKERLYIFRFNDKSIKKGRIKKIVVNLSGVAVPEKRKQAAALAAAELYLYHYHSNTNSSHFRKIKSQAAFGGILARTRRNREILHVLAKCGLYDWANIDTHHQHTDIITHWSGLFSMLSDIDKRICKRLEIAEKEFSKIEDAINKSVKIKSVKALHDTGILIEQEIRELSYLIDLLVKEKGLLSKAGKSTKQLEEEIDALEEIRSSLQKVKKHEDKWEHKSKNFHIDTSHLTTKLAAGAISRLIDEQIDQEKVDLYEVHKMIDAFEHQKAKIIKNIRTLERKRGK